MKDKNRRKFIKDSFQLSALSLVGAASLPQGLMSCTEGTPMVSKKTIEVLDSQGNILELDADEVQEVKQKFDKVHHDLREGIPGRKFVMVIDLAKCKNALACQRSCNKHHAISGDNAWIKVYKMQDSAHSAPYWLPVTCQHCDQPACVTVCPVDATFKRKDGLVLIDNERCIGCRFCMAACPYSIRVFNWSEPDQGEISLELGIDLEHHHSSPEYAGMPSKMGTVDKCDFCPHAVQNDELPHCVSACPNGVIYFGDRNEDVVTNGDESLVLSALLEKRAGYRLLDELGTEPNVYYLPPVDRLVPFEEGLEDYTEFESVQKPQSGQHEK